MKKTILGLGAVVCGLLLAQLPLLAHHSFSAVFDLKKPIKLSGTVTKLEWQNPHTWFYIDVKDENGKVSNWGMEMGSPNLLIRSGWIKSALSVGDQVSVEGYQAKDGSNNGNAEVVILAKTGQRLFAGSSKGNEPAR
jgi:Family of unknown function (DUF6152)